MGKAKNTPGGVISVKKFALRRLRYHRSRSVLTAIAIALTATLLTALGSAAVGLVDFQQKTIASGTGNHHATFKGVSVQQAAMLEDMDAIQSLVLRESFATVVKGNLNAALNYNSVIREGISQIPLTEGRLPQTPGEIAGPPSIFERLDAIPAIGETVTISFRVHDEGEIITRTFTITGLQEQADLSVLNVSDARLAFSATVSEGLVREYLQDSQRYFNAQIRVDEALPYKEIEALINSAASAVGLAPSDISYNSAYLLWMTDPGSGSSLAMAGLGLLVVLLGGMVIYNIYYVSVISNIQELGKLRALGAARGQMKQLLLWEGLILAAIAVPTGVALGYLCSFALFSYMRGTIGQEITAIRIFSLPVTLLAVGAVLATVLLSLGKPMNMAARISPVEAMRYQEQAPSRDRGRKSFASVSLASLSIANLGRNRKRTLSTILTLGLTCVLFLSIATVLGNINVEDYARQVLRKGDFMLTLNYSLNDSAYPENNLDFIQRDNPLGDSLQSQIISLSGVTAIEARYAVTAAIDHPAYERGKYISIGTFSRQEAQSLQADVRRGALDYDQMTSQGGIAYTWEAFFNESGFAIGESLPVTLYYGEKTVPFQAALSASTTVSSNEFWMPEDLFFALLPGADAAETLYISADSSSYESVKAALQELEADLAAVTLYSLDEETRIAQAALQNLKYPIYGLLLIVGVISFMSLINTMVTSILTRKRELGILQAIGLSNRQLRIMLQNEGMFLTAGALLCGLVLGNLIGFLAVRLAAAADLITLRSYRFPLAETLILIGAMALGQLCVTLFISRYIHKETLVTRMRSQE